MANRYLNTIGSWSTYRDLKSMEQVPERLEQVTAAFFGLSGLLPALRDGASGKQAVAGTILSAILAIHAVEQVTGSLVTAGIRLYGRGQPLAKYRGLIIRRSPFVESRARLLGRLTGGRLLAATGYYFHEGGRTWHAQSYTFRVKGTPRTLTQVRSLSFPAREHYFDRPLVLREDEAGQVGVDGETRSVYLQRIIDLVKGDEAPAAIPGYIGSTNDLENAGPLGSLKRTLFTANWFLVDESERDDPAAGSDFVDYDALLRGHAAGQQNQPGYYRVKPPAPARPVWPSTAPPRSYARPIRTATTAPPANPYQELAQQAAAASTPTPEPKPKPVPIPKPKPAPTNLGQAAGTGRLPDPARIQNRWRAPDGKEYPILIERVITNPISKLRKAKNAFYHDGQHWRQITDDQALQALAQAYDRGEQTTVDEGGIL